MHPQQPLWTFSEIASIDSDRAALLEAAPDSEAIQAAVISQFETALTGSCVRIGMEQSASHPCDLRAVLQFPIGATLFDQFFNSNTGYRAQFRRDWRAGLAYNRRIVAELRSKVESQLLTKVEARLITPKFEGCGVLTVSRKKICISLDPDLSKVWFCGLLISGDGRILQLPSGATGPRLQLDTHTTWPALARDEADAWLEVKGAFVGRNGLYQPKDPADRARKLNASGEA